MCIHADTKGTISLNSERTTSGQCGEMLASGGTLHCMNVIGDYALGGENQPVAT